MKDSKITFCPNCQKPIEAKEYFSKGGVSDWRVESVGITIVCSQCNYSGLPLTATMEDYEKIAKKRKK